MKDEFDALLECGILAYGLLRLHCGDCGHDKLVALSCERRWFCPSCGARRMAQPAAYLVDHVIHAGTPVGAHLGHETAHPAAPAAGRTAQAGDAGVAGGAPRNYTALA